MWADFSFALSAAAFLLSVAACFVAAGFASRVQALQRLVQLWSESPSASSSTLLTQRLDELEESIQLVANKMKMQRVRAAANHAERKTDELPDPYRDPDGWRTAMNARIARGKVGGGNN